MKTEQTRRIINNKARFGKYGGYKVAHVVGSNLQVRVVFLKVS